MNILFALISGALFGTGLFISGMTNTAKVQGWLDVFGQWDPTLAFVMGGAIIPMAIAWIISTKMKSAVNGESFPVKNTDKPGQSLIIGSTLFGAGWGLAGLCPGPSIASLGYGGVNHWVFVAAMAAGMFLAPIVKPLIIRQP